MSTWTTVVSLKAMTDGMNLDGLPLDQTECQEDENSDLSQINPLGYLGRTIRIRTQNSDNLDAKNGRFERRFRRYRRFGVVLDDLDVNLGQITVWGQGNDWGQGNNVDGFGHRFVQCF